MQFPLRRISSLRRWEGHDFSRAVSRKRIRASAPEVSLLEQHTSAAEAVTQFDHTLARLKSCPSHSLPFPIRISRSGFRDPKFPNSRISVTLFLGWARGLGCSFVRFTQYPPPGAIIFFRPEALESTQWLRPACSGLLQSFHHVQVRERARHAVNVELSIRRDQAAG